MSTEQVLQNGQRSMGSCMISNITMLPAVISLSCHYITYFPPCPYEILYFWLQLFLS
jgi:hypothetical protein